MIYLNVPKPPMTEEEEQSPAIEPVKKRNTQS